MKFEAVKRKDLSEILGMVKQEFPYTGFTLKRFEGKLADDRIELFKLSGKEGLLGFIEIEWLEEAVARINAVVVKKKFRRQGLGQQLSQKALGHLLAKGAQSIILLVDKENTVAKKLYQGLGFNFLKDHEKKIGGKRLRSGCLTLFSKAGR